MTVVGSSYGMPSDAASAQRSKHDSLDCYNSDICLSRPFLTHQSLHHFHPWEQITLPALIVSLDSPDHTPNLTELNYNTRKMHVKHSYITGETRMYAGYRGYDTHRWGAYHGDLITRAWWYQQRAFLRAVCRCQSLRSSVALDFLLLRFLTLPNNRRKSPICMPKQCAQTSTSSAMCKAYNSTERTTSFLHTRKF